MNYTLKLILFILFSFYGQTQNCPEDINNSPGNSPGEIVAEVYDGDGNLVQSIACEATGNSNQIDCDLASYSFPSDHFILIELTSGSNSTTCAYDSNGELMSMNPLPVELVNLSGHEIDGLHRIKWSTASESNCGHYSVLRSYDGINWSEIGTRIGAGNSDEMSNYQIDHEPSRSGTIYYKVIQYDHDGEKANLGIISLTNYENPISVKDQRIIVNTAERIREIKVVSSRGRLLHHEDNLNDNYYTFTPSTNDSFQLLYISLKTESGRLIRKKILF